MKKSIQTDLAPAAIGPYSQGIIDGKLLFISGQLPLDPLSGKLIDGSMGELTRQAMNNILAVCAEAGAKPSQIVKTTIFLTDLAKFGEVNEAYAEFFKETTPPARSTIGVAALPLNSPIEVEAVVILQD
ncbi:MAG: Rid family detoxifying hydrolase [Desulfocapsaceae bacterium]|nr:Rid family detoxifying hydrolase [Desulfocapsaceae bacterium]